MSQSNQPSNQPQKPIEVKQNVDRPKVDNAKLQEHVAQKNDAIRNDKIVKK